MTKVAKWTGIEASETKQFEIEYRYCPSRSGALSARIKKDSDGDIESWLRYEYSGLQLLRIDEVYDADDDGTLEGDARTGDVPCLEPLGCGNHLVRGYRVSRQ